MSESKAVYDSVFKGDYETSLKLDGNMDSLEEFYIRKGEQESKRSVYPRYRSVRNPGLNNDSVSAYFAYLLKEDPSLFEKKISKHYS